MAPTLAFLCGRRGSNPAGQGSHLALRLPASRRIHKNRRSRARASISHFLSPAIRLFSSCVDITLCSCINPFLGLLKDHALKHLRFAVQVGHHVESLESKAKMLEAKLKDVRERIQADGPLGKKPTNEVAAWLSDAEAVQGRAQSIIGEYGRRNFNRFSSHRIGRRAADELPNVEAALQNIALVTEITTGVPPPPAQEMPTTALTEEGGYEIRQKLEMAREFLEDDAEGALGLWGMGGVGKTTLLEHINDSLAQHPSAFGFHHVVFLVASRECTVEKVQELLRKKLGLNEADQICGYLRNKSFVLLLDDLWEPLDLKQAGIPLPFGADGQFRRKLILTTRFQRVCRNMDVPNIIEVKCLSPEAARRLFLDKVGGDTINAHPQIPKLADEVAKECDGLPLALITIGRAMAGKRTVQLWEHALKQLRQSKLSHISGIDDPLPLLKFSYDHLKDPNEQQCFLLCALWPEDHEICKEELIECWMGHGLLEDDVDEIEDVYNQGYDIIDSLQKACLLESVEASERGLLYRHVKLHDVIRDMALWIVGDCGENEKKWIVLDLAQIRELPQDTRVWSEVHKMLLWNGDGDEFPYWIPSCPKLTTLFFPGGHLNEDDVEEYEDDVEEYEDDSEEFYHIPKFPPLGHFSELRYLNLYGCYGGFPIEICSLIKLEFLDVSCTGASSFPDELKNLRNLKYLIAIETRISRLPDDLIANLVSLLYLNLFSVSPQRDRYCKDIDSQTSIIDGLSCVKGSLKAIGISVSTKSDMEKLDRLDMDIRHLSIYKMTGTSSLPLPSGYIFGKNHRHWNLKQLSVADCALEELVVDEGHHLSKLDELWLENLRGLKEVIWKRVEPHEVLLNLRDVSITGCHRLEHVTWTANLPCLEYMCLLNCTRMKHLIWTAKPHETAFPRLRMLSIMHLQVMKSICHESICHPVLAFPSLEHLAVLYCERLTKLGIQSPPSLGNIKHIEGQRDWWNNLEMDDVTRNFLQPFYRDG